MSKHPNKEKMKNKEILFEAVTKNDNYGYFELKDEYRKNMQNFYKDEYYQDDYATYNHVAYDPIDMENKNNFYNQKLFVFKNYTNNNGKISFLDLGAGEGYALTFFDKLGWEVTGIDLSSYGMKQHNPDMLSRLLQGDAEEIIEKLSKEQKTFDFINADNVLEHVNNPEKFFQSLKKISHAGTILCVTVPNDYSTIQHISYDMDIINRPFWVTSKTSEHFTYFSVDSLTALGENQGFEKMTALANWPIDFFLLNPKTNYVDDRTVGHDCHIACAKLENAICRKSMSEAVTLFQALASSGIGRDISVFFRCI